MTVTLCIKCGHHTELEGTDFCNNTELPLCGFVRGDRYCDELNTEGNCKGFKPKPEPESIYESKADEDLAKA